MSIHLFTIFSYKVYGNVFVAMHPFRFIPKKLGIMRPISSCSVSPPPGEKYKKSINKELVHIKAILDYEIVCFKRIYNVICIKFNFENLNL